MPPPCSRSGSYLFYPFLSNHKGFDAGSPEQQARWIALYEDAVRKATGYDDTDDTEDEVSAAEVVL